MFTVPIPMTCEEGQVYVYDTQIMNEDTALALVYIPTVKDWQIINIARLIPDREFRSTLNE